jgi:hypothetical protein
MVERHRPPFGATGDVEYRQGLMAFLLAA